MPTVVLSLGYGKRRNSTQVNSLQNQEKQPLGKTEGVLHQDKGEACFYRKSPHHSPWLVYFYANEKSK